MLVALLLSTAVLSLRNYSSFQLGVYADDASYVVLARSTIETDDYGLMNVPGAPLPTRYPFGFPLVLSLLLGPGNMLIESLKFVSLLATLVSLLILFFGWPYLIRGRSYWWALAVCALYGWSPEVIGHTRMVMSEPTFLALTLLGIVLTERVLASRDPAIGMMLLTGCVIAAAFFVRTVGIALVISSLARIALLISVSWRERLARAFTMMLGMVLFAVLSAGMTPVDRMDLLPTQYGSELGSDIGFGGVAVSQLPWERFASATGEYLTRHLKDALLPLGGGANEIALAEAIGLPILPEVIALAVSLIVIIGVFATLQERWPVPTVMIYMGLYLAITFLWPWRTVRFLYPILPFLFYFLLSGLGSLILISLLLRTNTPNSQINAFRVPAAAGITAILALSLFAQLQDSSRSTDFARDLTVGSSWLKANTPDTSIIMAQEAQSIFLYSDRKAVDYNGVKSSRQLRTRITESDVDYLMIAPKLEWRVDGTLAYDQYTADELLPIVQQMVANGELTEVYHAEQHKVSILAVDDPKVCCTGHMP